MDGKAHINELFRKYLANDYTDEELDELLHYFQLEYHQQSLRALVQQELENAAFSAEENRRIDRLVNHAGVEIFARVDQQRPIKKRPHWPLYRIAAAAIVLVAIGLGIYLYVADGGIDRGDVTHYAPADVEPGGNKAVLTLADGRKIVLDDVANGELAEESGIKITKTEDGQIVYEIAEAPATGARQSLGGNRDGKGGKGVKYYAPTNAPTYNTIQTPRGGQYKVILPDGSTVWLNSASSLKYPSRFDGGERKVELTGEAFFAIVVGAQDFAPLRNKRIPFIVTTATQEVTVLGTQFNVSAYADEASVKTTLVNGAVKVESTAGASVSLVPNEQSILTATAFAKQQVDVTEYTAWKDGLFVLDNVDFSQFVRQVERWYDVDFVVEANVDGLKVSGIIPRNVNLSQLLSAVEDNTGLKFKIVERRIMVGK